MNVPKNIKIIDFGCGTGYLGIILNKNGFTDKFDGFDASQKMLDICKDTGVYGELDCVFVGVDNFPKKY